MWRLNGLSFIYNAFLVLMTTQSTFTVQAILLLLITHMHREQLCLQNLAQEHLKHADRRRR